MTYVRLVKDKISIPIHFNFFMRDRDLIHISGMINRRFAWLNRVLEENKDEMILIVGILRYVVEIKWYSIKPDGKRLEQTSEIEIMFKVKEVRRDGEVYEVA